MNQAAGVLFLAPGNKALFLKRGPNSDHPGEWCLPGGWLEKDELPEDAAARETREEIGHLPAGVMVEHTRQQDGVDFTTFRQQVSAEFSPNLKTLYNEHIGYAWAPVDAPPEPLHPGVKIALDRLGMDELEVARAIADGRLTSPQKVGGFALYAMRMSGTGVSYRRGLDEFVWRDPAVYLSQEMIDRCAGLPVIMEHPEAATLNSDEFADRVIGAAMFGYVQDDELWCIARVYDADAIDMMDKQQLSTSPAVVFGDPSVNSKMTLKDGKELLIEGKPSILDHLAVCAHGVWDKGGPATGIDVVRKDSQELRWLVDFNIVSPKERLFISHMQVDVLASDRAAAIKYIERKYGTIDVKYVKKDSVTMTEEEKKADAARKDAEEKEAKEREEAEKKADADAGEKLDNILKCLDSLGKRMDAYEMADKSKRDAEEEEHAEGKEKKPVEEAGEFKKLDKSKKDAEEKEAKGEKEEAEKLAADKAKKDAEEKEKEEREKMDAARKDSDDTRRRIKELEAQIDGMRSRLPKPSSDKDFADMARIQADADRTYSAHGKSAPRAMDGETLLAYRRRLVNGLKHHSSDWKDADLGVISMDSVAFDIAEKRIYADAMDAALHPAVSSDEMLLETRRRDPETGHLIKEYHGAPRAWMSSFSGGPPRLAKFRLDKGVNG